MKKILVLLILLSVFGSMGIWADTVSQKRPYLPANVTTLDATGDVTIGGDVTIESLTEGSVSFIGTGGLISEDTTDFTYDDGLNTLTVTRTETLQIVTAKAGENISQGDAVYILSATGDKPQVFLADNTLHDSSHDLGVATETKTTGQNIAIGVYGELINVDTSGFTAAGDRMHVGSSGNMQSAALASGAHIHMGHVTKKDATEGIMFIAPNDYVHDIRGVTDEPIKISTGDDASTYNIQFNNYSQSPLGFMQGNGLFTWNGDQLFVGNGSGLAYGGIYTKDSVVGLVIDADLTETEVTVFTVNEDSNNTTPSHSLDIITITTAGRYMVMVSAVIEDDGNANHEFHMEMFKNAGANEGANSTFLAAPDCDATCATNDIITATHAFTNGDIVYLDTATGYTNVLLNTEYYVCEVTGTTSFGLTDNVAGAGADCEDGAATQIILTAENPAGTLRVIGTVIPNVHAHEDFRTSTDKMSLSLSGIVNLAVSDTISIWMRTDDSTARTVTVSDITMSIFQIGG